MVLLHRTRKKSTMSINQKMKGWDELGVVDTIYEEEEEEDHIEDWCTKVLDSERIDEQLMDELVGFNIQDFQVVVDSMRKIQPNDHDLLYEIISLYLQNHNGSITEELKNIICQSINCNKLSYNKLLHLVQNPHLPVRFLFQSMMIYQQHAQDTNQIEIASCQIESLERDVEGMRRKLKSMQEKKAKVEKESILVKLMNGVQSLFKSRSGKEGEEMTLKGKRHRRKCCMCT